MTGIPSRISLPPTAMGRRCSDDAYRGELKMAKKFRRAAQRNYSAQEFELERLLEYVRFAVTMINKDDRELEKAVAGLAEQGLMADLLREWTLSSDHFKGLANLCDTAVSRSVLAMERLGYSPDKPVPKRSLSKH